MPISTFAPVAKRETEPPPGGAPVPRVGLWLPAAATLTAMVVMTSLGTLLVARLSPSRGPNLARACRVSASEREPTSEPAESVVDGDAWTRGFVSRSGDRPWLLLDLGSDRVLRRVVVINCYDCPLDNDSPLVLELSRDGRSFVQAARHEGSFELWDQPILGAQARFIRLRLDRSGSLRLREVEVY
jgi:hypothetical protein